MKASTSGFTLIEMIVTVAIIASLAAILVPIVSGELADTGTATAQGETRRIGTALNQFFKLVRPFDVTVYTEQILRDPARFAATDILPPGSAKRLIALLVYRIVPFVFPGFIYTLKKQAGQPLR